MSLPDFGSNLAIDLNHLLNYGAFSGKYTFKIDNKMLA